MTVEELLDRLVKPLVWEDQNGGRWIGTPVTRLADLAFWIFLGGDMRFKRVGRSGWEYYSHLQPAQAAAEADYRAKIAAALDQALLERLAEMMGDAE